VQAPIYYKRCFTGNQKSRYFYQFKKRGLEWCNGLIGLASMEMIKALYVLNTNAVTGLVSFKSAAPDKSSDNLKKIL